MRRGWFFTYNFPLFSVHGTEILISSDTEDNKILVDFMNIFTTDQDGLSGSNSRGNSWFFMLNVPGTI